MIQTPGNPVVYTAPAGEAVIVRSIVLCSVHAAAQLIAAGISSGSFSAYLVSNPGAVAYQPLAAELRQALLEGESLFVGCSLGPVTYAITGYVFIG